MPKLTASFYRDNDVLTISKALLGKVLVTNFNGEMTAGMIVETEAYRGPEDKASHAHNNKRTPRTETMFKAGGVAYVYLCYGIHHLFNIVTGPINTPHAVLIRALEPIDGIDIMLQRRKLAKLKSNLSAGPGMLTQALGITTKHDAESLLAKQIWVEDRNFRIPAKKIIAAPRIGIDYAQEYIDLPWRFYIQDNPWVSILDDRSQTNIKARALSI